MARDLKRAPRGRVISFCGVVVKLMSTGADIFEEAVKKRDWIKMENEYHSLAS